MTERKTTYVFMKIKIEPDIKSRKADIYIYVCVERERERPIE